MTRLKSCPKCNGRVMIDRDEYGWYESCMQCGHTCDVSGLVKAPQQHYEKEKREPASMYKQTTSAPIFSHQPLIQDSIVQSPPESPVKAHYKYYEKEKTEIGPIRKQTIKVSTFSYQPLIQEGILKSLSRTEDIQVISQAKATDKEPIVGAVPPDVAIVDIDGPSNSVLSIVHRLKEHLPTVSIIVLTSNTSDNQISQLIENRVAAYVSKEINGDQLAALVRRVANGEYPIYEGLPSQPEVIANVLEQLQQPSRNTEERALAGRLTAREVEVLSYVARGYGNKQIAAKVNTSTQTIKNQVYSIMLKLNAKARTQAVVIASQQGLISIA